MRLLAEVLTVVVVTIAAFLSGAVLVNDRRSQIDRGCLNQLITQVAQTGSTHPLPVACGAEIITGG